MVDRKIRWGKVLAVIAIGLATIHYFKFFLSPKVKMETPPSNIPAPEIGRPVWVYDLYKDKWIYLDQRPGPAKDNIKLPSRYSEKNYNQFLEEHIKGYKRKTYWGEKYDQIDPEDKYDHDRIDFDEIENEYGRRK